MTRYKILFWGEPVNRIQHTDEDMAKFDDTSSEACGSTQNPVQAPQTAKLGHQRSYLCAAKFDERNFFSQVCLGFCIYCQTHCDVKRTKLNIYPRLKDS